MLDRFNRKINYLRVSVTDRCNLRCKYCMPPEGIKLVSHDDTLSFDEIVQTVSHAVSIGVDKVRITGGEPLVRKGVVDLVKMLSGIQGINDLSMTTNGILLERFASELAEAGLMRVNISLDSVDADTYCNITRGGNIDDVMRGIEAARRAGLSPIKINCVVKYSPEEKDAIEVAEFCKKNNLEVRFIREMDLEKGIFTTVYGGTGGDCEQCNRLRLTATGDILPCLFSDTGFNIRQIGIKNAVENAIINKPQNGCFALKNKFYNTGG